MVDVVGEIVDFLLGFGGESVGDDDWVDFWE